MDNYVSTLVLDNKCMFKNATATIFRVKYLIWKKGVVASENSVFKNIFKKWDQIKRFKHTFIIIMMTDCLSNITVRVQNFVSNLLKGWLHFRRRF